MNIREQYSMGMTAVYLVQKHMYIYPKYTREYLESVKCGEHK